MTKSISNTIELLYQKLHSVIPRAEWVLIAPLLDEILQLKAEKKVMVLAHNYMTPDIFYGIADVVGDSLALAREAVQNDCPIILVCGVHFMAETVKLLNPDKKVLIADLEAGCSLAQAISAKDVLELRRRHPGAPVVTYVNTSAEVKAVSDICCTSGNALEVIESFSEKEIIFIPDKYLAQNVSAKTQKKIHTWEGSCIVHEQFTPQDIHDLRKTHKGLVVVSHPECPSDVVAVSDFSGSTARMIDFVKERRPSKVALITECSMSDNVAVQFPEIDFIRPCNLCPFMKKITIPKILKTLQSESPEVVLKKEIIEPARRAIERMLTIKQK